MKENGRLLLKVLENMLFAYTPIQPNGFQELNWWVFLIIYKYGTNGNHILGTAYPNMKLERPLKTL